MLEIGLRLVPFGVGKEEIFKEVVGLGMTGEGNINMFQLAKSPVKVEVLKQEVAHYPNKKAANQLLEGFQSGFPICYTGPRLPFDSKNLKSLSGRDVIVIDKLQKELQAGRIAGPFVKRPISTLRVSPIGLVEKKVPGDFRLIHHLSYPEGNSVNDNIDPQLCSVRYTSFDEVIHMIQDLGQGCLLGKADIKSAFRLLPVRPQDFDQLGFKFQGQYYFDKSLPFGLAVSPATFELFSTFLEWLVLQKSTSGNLKHYLDDFLFAGRENTQDCLSAMKTFFACFVAWGYL